jgi:hypothetical protein
VRSWLQWLFGQLRKARKDGPQVTASIRFGSTGHLKIRVTRLEYTDYGVFGHLETDGFDCVTLERDDTLVPPGTYKVTMYDSPHNKCVVPLLHVPGRSFIEIHVANWETQLQGCIAVGESRDGKGICHSRDAFNQLMSALNKAVEWEIEIR